MRVFLDDERQTPAGWIRAHWPSEVIRHLESGGVAELSLDHDLGDDSRGTGYDVIVWIEEAVALRGFRPPAIHVHSANSAARLRMQAGIANIERLAASAAQDTHRAYLARVRAKLGEPIDGGHGAGGKKYARAKAGAPFAPLSYPGCTVLAKPYPIAEQGILMEISRRVGLASPRIACVPPSTLHVTLADLLAGRAYSELTLLQRERLVQRAREIVAASALGTINAHVAGVVSFPGVIVALIGISDDVEFQRVADLRARLYGDSDLAALGVRAPKPFLAHVTLGYLEEPPLPANQLAQLAELNKTQGEHFAIHGAGLFAFANMSGYSEV